MSSIAIDKAEFKARRERLLAMMDKNSVAIIPAAGEVTRSRDTEYAFRQDSDFFYLTGFNEPDAVLVLCPSSDIPSTLICRNKDKLAEIWHGRRLGADAAKQQLADQWENSDMRKRLRALEITLRQQNARVRLLHLQAA